MFHRRGISWKDTGWRDTYCRFICNIDSSGSLMLLQLHSVRVNVSNVVARAWKLVPLWGALSHRRKTGRCADWFHKPTFERAIKITGGQLIILLRNHNVNLTHFVNTCASRSATALSVSKGISTLDGVYSSA